MEQSEKQEQLVLREFKEKNEISEIHEQHDILMELRPILFLMQVMLLQSLHLKFLIEILLLDEVVMLAHDILLHQLFLVLLLDQHRLVIMPW